MVGTRSAFFFRNQISTRAQLFTGPTRAPGAPLSGYHAEVTRGARGEGRVRHGEIAGGEERSARSGCERERVDLFFPSFFFFLGALAKKKLRDRESRGRGKCGRGGAAAPEDTPRVVVCHWRRKSCASKALAGLDCFRWRRNAKEKAFSFLASTTPLPALRDFLSLSSP